MENRFERGAETYAGEQLGEPAVVLATDAERWAQRGEWRWREGLLLVVQGQLLGCTRSVVQVTSPLWTSASSSVKWE